MRQVRLDAYRRGDEFVVHFDVPGVDPDSIDLTAAQGRGRRRGAAKQLEASSSAA